MINIIKRFKRFNATRKAKKALRPGDKICAKMRGGKTRWFYFYEWQGDWICSTGHVTDCHALHVYKVNDKPVNFAWLYNNGI